MTLTGTAVSNVALPQKAVVLNDLKTTDGAQVVVIVKRVSRLVLARIFESLPASADPVAQAQRAEEAPEVAQERTLSVLESVIPRAQKVVAAGSVEPRFSEDGSNDSIPLEALSEEDLTLLVNAILELSGWTTEAPGGGDATFPADGARRGSGDGDMEAGPEHGPDAVAGA